MTVSAPTLLALLLGGALVLGAAFQLARFTREGRELQTLWTAALAILLLLPLLAAALPTAPVPMPDELFDLGVPIPPPTKGLVAPVPSDAGSWALLPEGRVTAVDTSTTSAPTGAHRLLETPTVGPRVLDVGLLLLALWASGALVLLTRVLGAQLSLRRLEARAEEVSDPAWLEELDVLRTDLGIAPPVRLLTDPSVTTPMTWGVRSPVIALPPGALAWTAEERRVVLLHELAHIRRRDAARLLVARLACILHWPDPLAWRTLRRLAVEHERACDRRVLERGVLPSVYAQQLLRLSRSRPIPRLSGALAMARRTSLEVRVMSILDPRSNASVTGARRRTFLAVAVLGLLGVGVAVVTPAPPAEAVVRAHLASSLAGAAQTRPAESSESSESSEDLEGAIAAARELEREMRVYEERMRAAELEMREALTPIEELETRLAPHHEELRRLEAQHRAASEPMRELERRLEAEHAGTLAELEHRLEEAHREIEAESEPLVAELEALELQLRELVEPLEREQRLTEPTRRRFDEIQEQMISIQRQLEELHSGLEPMHRELEQEMAALEPQRRALEEAMHSLEPNRREMEEVQRRMEEVQREMERAQEGMEPIQERMEEIQREMEPLHRRMEEVHRRLEGAVTGELRGVLERHLGELHLDASTLDRAAITVRDSVDLRIDDQRLRIRGSRSELRELLAEITGVAETHPAIDETVDALLDLDTSFE